MSEFPSMPLFTDAYLADTRHLTAQEHGAYLLLLMMAWRTPDCRLPDDDAKLAKWASVDARTWKRIKAAVMEFWTPESGTWVQKRLAKEREFVSTRAEVARQNGKLGGRPKSLNSNGSDNPVGSSQVSQPKAPNPSPNPSKEEEIQTIAQQHTALAAPSSDLDQLMDKLLLAAGISGFREERAPGLVSLAPVLGLLEQGYSLEGDILPVIRDISRRGKRPGSWKYFVNPVIEAAAAKRSIPQKPTETIDWSGRLIVFFTSNTWAAGWGPKPDEPGCKAPLEAIDHARTTVGRAA